MGAVTAGFMTWLWGGLDQVAVIHDEAAYLLQAKLYAGFHWTAPGLPLPEFFEQYHVLVTPVMTPKYLSGARVHARARHLARPAGSHAGSAARPVRRADLRRRAPLTNPWIGLLSWLLWMTAPA